MLHHFSKSHNSSKSFCGTYSLLDMVLNTLYIFTLKGFIGYAFAISSFAPLLPAPTFPQSIPKLLFIPMGNAYMFFV